MRKKKYGLLVELELIIFIKIILFYLFKKFNNDKIIFSRLIE